MAKILIGCKPWDCLTVPLDSQLQVTKANKVSTAIEKKLVCLVIIINTYLLFCLSGLSTDLNQKIHQFFFHFFRLFGVFKGQVIGFTEIF